MNVETKSVQMERGLVIGVDIGGTRTKAGLVDISTGQVLHCMIYPTEKKDAAIFLELMGDAISHLTEVASL